MSITDTTHRFSDVIGEPCTMLAPIEGFNKKPLVTLEEATEPLKTIVPRLETYVHIAKARAENAKSDLSIDESAAIGLYTMEWTPFNESLYFILNTTLRAADRQGLKPWFLYLKLILTALSRFQTKSLTVYRGIKFENKNEFNFENYQLGKEIIWWGFSSCSENKNVALKEQFLGDDGIRILFIIQCIKGRNIGKHSYFIKEDEVLLFPATTVKVVKREFVKNDLCEIHLQEIESKYPYLESISSNEEIQALKAMSITNTKSLTPTASLTEPDRNYNARLHQYIARCRPNAEVYLIGRRFNLADIEVIVEQLIKIKQCRQLFIRESGITCQGAEIIAKALDKNNTLEQLFISHNMIGDEGAKAFAHVLSDNKNTTLKELCLGYNNITDEGIEYIAEMLQSNKTLTHLWLPSNEITDKGLQRLADVLVHKNKTLKLISLEWNKFHNDASVNILVDMLKQNTSLIKLNLNRGGLSRSSIKPLKKAAKDKKYFELNIY